MQVVTMVDVASAAMVTILTWTDIVLVAIAVITEAQGVLLEAITKA